MKKIIMFVMVLVIGLTAGIANAALLASESFEYEYTANASLAGQDGGTGWDGPWDRDRIGPAPGAPATIGAGSLEPPGVVGTGNHVEVVDNTGNAEEWFNRELTTPLLDDGSTYWVSVVFQKSNNDNDNSWCGFSVGENIWFGKGYDEDNIWLGDDGANTGVPATDLSWLVLKIETNPVADEQVYLWVNPDAGDEPSTFTANANLEIPLLGDGTLPGEDSFVIEYGGSGTANSSDFKCDEIRIGTSFDDIVYYGGPKNPIIIDPNVMTVYETDETEGNFTVSLKFPPVGQGSPGNAGGTPISVDIIVDPNGYLTQAGELRGGGGNPDITLIGGSGPHNRITFTRTGANWDVPEVIRFRAIDDDLAEKPTLFEVQNIAVWAVPTPHEPNLARPVAQRIVRPAVIDNDQATILFSVSPPEQNNPKTPVTGPVQIWEEPRDFFGTPVIRWKKIWVTLQVPPKNTETEEPTEVKLSVEVTGSIEGDNLPIMDPPLTVTSEPNSLIFTAGNYNVSQPIKIWGNDDAELQIEEATAEGDQNYQAVIVFTVIDGGGDERYEWTVLEDPEDPCNLDTVPVFLEREVDIDIEDNECGAFGILVMDVGNPNAFTDPNYRDSDGNPLPDCYVNIYDAIEVATQWLDCSYLQDPSCESYLEE